MLPKRGFDSNLRAKMVVSEIFGGQFVMKWWRRVILRAILCMIFRRQLKLFRLRGENAKHSAKNEPNVQLFHHSKEIISLKRLMWGDYWG